MPSSRVVTALLILQGRPASQSPAGAARSLWPAGHRFFDGGKSMGFVWDDTTISALRQHCAEGKTSAEIAGLIGAPSRNAVLGKAHRLGLSVRPLAAHTMARKATLRRPPLVRLKPAGGSGAPAPRPVVKRTGPVTFADLEPHHCKFPIGDPRDLAFRFCGQERLPGRPYCIACTDRSIARKEAA